MTTTLTYEGLVETWDQPDCSDHALTVRVGGIDLIAAIGEAELNLRDPVMAAVTIATDAPVTGRLNVYGGNSAGCETCYEGASFEVGNTNMLRAFDAHDGQHVTVTVTLGGAAQPPSKPPIPSKPPAPPRIVTVELAHHLRDGGKPGGIRQMPSDEAQDLAEQGVITRESAAAAGLKVPA